MRHTNTRTPRNSGGRKATDGRLLKRAQESSGPSAFMNQVFSKIVPKDMKIVKKVEATPDNKEPKKGTSAGDPITLMIAKNPEMNASTFYNLLKSQGFIISAPGGVMVDKKEADSSSANVAALRAKESGKINFRTRFLEADKSHKSATGLHTVYKVCLIEEGMGNFGASNYYSRAALESAVSVFEGRKIYADHPEKSEAEERPERSVRDVLGHFENLNIQEGVGGQALLCGDLVVMGGQSYQWARELMEHAVAYAKKFPDKEFVGLSVNAAGDSSAISMEELMSKPIPESAIVKINEAKANGITEVNFVDAFTEAVSCDLVTEAGAGGKILNLIEGAKMANKEETTEGGPGSGPSKGGGSGDAKAVAARTKARFDKGVAATKTAKHGAAVKSGKKAADDAAKDRGYAKSIQQLRKKYGSLGSPVKKKKESNIKSEEEMSKKKIAKAREADEVTGDEQDPKGDAGHDDAGSDEQLIKSMIAKHMGEAKEGEEPAEMSDEESAVAKEAYEAHKEMGCSDEDAAKEAAKYLKASKHMAAKREAAEAAKDEPADDKVEETVEEAVESTESKEAVKESAAPVKTELEVLKEENIRLKGENSALTESKRKVTIAQHVEKVCKESKLHKSVTSEFKKLVETAKSVEEVDKAFKIFSEGYKSKASAEGGLDFGGMIIESEKSSFTESAGGAKGIDFKSMTIED